MGVDRSMTTAAARVNGNDVTGLYGGRGVQD